MHRFEKFSDPKFRYADKRRRPQGGLLHLPGQIAGAIGRQLLLIYFVRYLVALVRFVWFARIRRNLRTFYSTDHESREIAAAPGETTLEHNLRSYVGAGLFSRQTINALSVRRSDRLIFPIVAAVPERRDMRVLTIGPRTEGEILNLMAHGFRRENISALDLQSYSPWVTLGDMHDIPFPDDSFECVITGWALPYSNSKQKAVDEMVRVLKDGGLLMMAATYRPDTPAFTEKPIESSQDLRDFLGNRLRHVFFDCDAKKIDPQAVGAVMLLAMIDKQEGGTPENGGPQP